MEKLDGKTLNIVEDNIKKLKSIFPEVFNEDKIDFEKLDHVKKKVKVIYIDMLFSQMI